MFKKHTSFILLFLFVYILNGQSFHFTSLSVNDGLSQATVLCLLQDQKGFLWIGTADGLNKYDGNKFEVFRAKNNSQNCISDNEVMALLEDKNGDIWIGTGNGLTRYKTKENKFEIFRSTLADSTTLSNNYVTTLFEDEDGFLLVGTKYGLNQFDPNTQKFKRIESKTTGELKKKFVKSIYKTSDNKYWIGYEDELCLFDKASKKLIQPTNSFGRLISTKGGKNILAFLEDRHGKLWMGTDKGVNIFDNEKQDFVLIPKTEHMMIFNFCQAADGSLWIGTNMGLCHIVNGAMQIQNYQHKPISSFSLSNNNIHSVLEDENGIMWIGTGSGLNKYSAYFSQFNTTRINEFNLNDFTSNKVWAIDKTSDGLLWIGSEGGLFGLNNQLELEAKYDKKNTSLTSVSFNSISKQADGNLWLGTYGGGLVFFDRKKNKFKNFHHNPNDDKTISSDVVKNLLLSKDETVLWVGTPKGLNRISLIDNKVSLHQFHSKDGLNIKANSITHLYEDQNNMLWVGTEGGLICYEYEKDFYRIFKHSMVDSNSISHDFIRTITQTNDKTIWVGTSKGLNKWNDEKMNFERYTVENGIANDVIYSIEEDSNNILWLGTNQGLSKFNPSNKEVINFDYHDGLQSNEFNTNASFKDQEGILYFGGINGFNKFKPEEINADSYAPRVHIGSVQTISKDGRMKNDYELGSLDQVLLSSVDDYFVTINFNAINFSNPEDNTYRYKLEGVDTEWRYTGNNTKVMYTNLPGGDYEFKVAVSNNNKWVESPDSLHIKLVPPFWKTSIFRILGGLFLLGILYLFFRFRLKKIEERNLELEKTIEKRTEDLVEQKKTIEDSEKVFRSFYENSPIGIAYFTKEKGAINRCNNRLSQMLGYSEKELLKKRIYDLTPPEDVEADEKRFLEAVSKKNDFWYRTKKRLVHKNGNIIHTSASLSFNWNEDEALDYTIIMFKDLTIEKAAQERLKQTQTQLLHADKMASLGQLTAGVAHEINNPVNFIYAGINGLKKNMQALFGVIDKYDQIQSSKDFETKKIEINELKKTIDYQEVRNDINELTRAIEDGAARTADIVESLQTFSRADKNERQFANIHQGLDSTIQILNKQIRDQIILVKKYDPEVPLLDCFPGRLNQVFLNILLNGIQAIGQQSKGEILVTTKYLEEKKLVQISIKDNGSGIPKKLLGRIFEPFFTTKEVGKGTGLGLSISYGIIKDHKGRIWVESIENESTTFHIELPV